MKILLIGHGKMGKIIEKLARERGHQIPLSIDVPNLNDLERVTAEDYDGAIEFTQPEAAFQNIKTCFSKGIPILSGTTGWLDHMPEIEKICQEYDGTFFYASNFSIGVNLFFKLNRYLAGIMDHYSQDYNVSIEEIHHAEKKDAPSGTAISLAQGVIENFGSKNNWVNQTSPTESELEILSVRKNAVAGTHTVKYSSLVDDLEIKHTALSRQGFALGALLAFEWMIHQKGILTMDDYLKDIMKD